MKILCCEVRMPLARETVYDSGYLGNLNIVVLTCSLMLPCMHTEFPIITNNANVQCTNKWDFKPHQITLYS